MIPQDTIERIYALTHIEEVVGDFVALKKAGSNYKGCCPFHDEKTPSFVVSPAKGIYKCFGCGKAGNAITFIREQEKCSFYDAIRYLGGKYHVEIVETEVSEEEKQKRDLQETLTSINKYATDFFEKTMWETEEGQNVGLSYFMDRGFTEETIRKFRLGYSPQKKNAFTENAERAGYKLEYLQQLGLSTVGDNYKLDRFHGRVMFPIMSVSGTVIGFGGRVMTPANEHVQGGAKYVNSPESEVYNKSRTLYGISLAKSEIVRKEECILVEGYTDVISMHQAGICNVVASSGTSLTNEQIDLIRRFTENIVIIYDGDNAGIKAATRGIDMILEKDLNVRVLLLPDGDDPDSFAKKHSSEEIAAYIEENKTDFLTFRTRMAAKKYQNDPIARAQFINSIAGTIAKIPNEVKRAVFIQECGKILNIDEQSFTNQVTRLLGLPTKVFGPRQIPGSETGKEEPKPQIDEILESEKSIIQLLVLYGTETITLQNSDPLYETNVYLLQKKAQTLNGTIDVPPPPSFQGLVKDYILCVLQQEFYEGEYLTLLNENERKIYDTYYEKFEEKQNDIVGYLRDFVAPERIADIISESQTMVDAKFWDKGKAKTMLIKDKAKDGEKDSAKENEQIAILIKDTLKEYIKRRYELKRKQLCDVLDQNTLPKIAILSDCINQLSKQMHHVSK